MGLLPISTAVTVFEFYVDKRCPSVFAWSLIWQKTNLNNVQFVQNHLFGLNM